jgi:hypothetical protein
MLLLSTSSITADGVTVFPDHADPNQFWYLPGPISLATLPGSDEPQFLLIEYTPDVAATGVKGVGFLNVTVCLKLSDDTRNDLIGQIRAAFPTADNPRLSPVPFDDGSVQIVALDLQGGGGTSNTAPAGTFEAVEHILGAVSPELFGDNDALFALTLSEDGAGILKAAFEDGMAPVGAIYNLKFTGVRPALDVKVTADLKRVYDSFSVGVSAKAYWVTAGIDATFEKLRQDGAIKIEVVNLAGDQANADKEAQALAIFKDQILSTWFTPSLSPATAAAADAGKPTLPASGTSKTTTTTTTNKPAQPPANNAGGMRSGGTPPGAGGMTGGKPSPTSTSPSVPAATGMTQPEHPAAPPAASSTTAPAASTAGTASPAAGAAPAATSAPPGASSTSTTTTTAPTAAGQAAGVANALAGAAQAASSAASSFGLGVSFKLDHQEELKTVTYEYNRMDAVQRTYAPQGYFGLLLGNFDKSKHFLQVDGTDQFFNKLSIAISPPKDFTGIGLQTAHVAIDYGDPGSSDVKHGEFVFDPAHNTPTSWDVFQGQIHTTEFTYAADYSFDPEAGWAAVEDRYQLPPQTTENRQLTLDPYAALGFLTVSITPGRIDPSVVDRIEAVLQYTADDGWQTSSTFIVRSDAAPQLWKVRVADKTKRSYTYTTTCVLKDGKTFIQAPATTTARAIVVNDPFSGGIDVVVEPAFDATKTKEALVEVDYEDQTANYHFQNTLYLPPGNMQPTRMHIPVLNPAQNAFAYRITTIGTDGAQHKGDLVTSQDPVVLVGDSP